MKGSSQIPFVRLVEKFEANLLCPHCEVICTADSRHCYICDQCVERFDHHCQWVNNCIGIQNHSYFYIFIILQDIYLVLVVIMAILSKYYKSSITQSLSAFRPRYDRDGRHIVFSQTDLSNPINCPIRHRRGSNHV